MDGWMLLAVSLDGMVCFLNRNVAAYCDCEAVPSCAITNEMLVYETNSL